MAGMPKVIVDRANHILAQLEQKHIEMEGSGSGQPQIQSPKTQAISTESIQLSIFETVDPTVGKIKEILKNLDLNSLTPIDCMMKLHEMKKLLEED